MLRRLVVVGDVAAVLVFVLVGSLHHGGQPFGNPLEFVNTATPFVLGWVAVVSAASLAPNVFPFSYLVSVPPAVRVVLLWGVAAPVGLALRATPLFPGDSPPAFVAVTLAFGAVFLATWRLSLSLARSSVSRTREEDQRQ